MSFISELRRRNVLRAGTAYLVLAWVLLQVGDVVFEAVGIERGQTVLLVLLGLGFLPALVFAWVFELTPEGLKRDAEVPRDAAAGRQAATRLNVVIVVLLALALASFGLGRLSVGGDAPVDGPAASESAANASQPATDGGVPASVPGAVSMAVLPFADLSPAGDQGYFSDGIAEEILNVLARVDGLRVASRTSAFQYREGSSKALAEIASELGVRYVLEGSVRKAGDSIRITAQLIDGPADEHLWSRTFDRTLSVENIFAVQDEIARAIVRELGGRMGLGQANTIRFAAAADTSNLRAYELYLEAREQFLDRARFGIEDLLRKYEEAVRLDPQFARAWEGLAAAYSVAPAWFRPGDQPDRDFAGLAAEAAEKALALDPGLALSRAVLGFSAKTEDGRSDYLGYMDALDRAIELDPAESTLWNWRGQTLVDLGFFDDGEADLLRCLELDPENDVALSWLMRARIYRGDMDGALAYAERMEQLGGGPRVALGMALAADGRDALARTVLAELVPPELGIDFGAWMLPLVHGDVDYDQQFEGLARVLEDAFAVDFEANAPADMQYFFKRYDRIEPGDAVSGQSVWWFPIHADFPRSEHWRRVIEEAGIARYWRQREWPPQCRPDGKGSFRCRVPADGA